MLLSCKKLGVKFLFKASDDIAFLKDTDLDLVFDASGNRLNQLSLDAFPDKTIQPASIPLEVSSDLALGFSPYGVRPEPCQDIKKIEVLTTNNLVVPTYNEAPIKTAMVKITGIPISLVEAVFNYIQHVNYDNRFYLWQGTLKDEINEALLIVNLTPEEYQVLQDYLLAPLALEVFIEHFSDWDILDRRFIELLRKIVQEVSQDFQVQIEPPFLYEPYMMGYTQQGENLHDRPLIRIGDSIYNGHVKCGNGITPHLCHIRDIHDALLKGQLNEFKYST